MSTEKRWIKPLLAEAAACKTKMPWERGLRRQAFISRRRLTEPAVPVTSARAVPRRLTA